MLVEILLYLQIITNSKNSGIQNSSSDVDRLLGVHLYARHYWKVVILLVFFTGDLITPVKTQDLRPPALAGAAVAELWSY
jgi:hypothetical protein